MKKTKLIERFYLDLKDLLKGQEIFIDTDEEMVKALLELIQQQKKQLECK